eukprot:NODE_543_length_1983_cov_17.673733_g435_i0.p1 GENE.NODE_543_length_1983_cov_17.673733_g435_i0~~NODE_543_length_1983_cov_17.673733_g435_i0.p1  ORF type:complete len:624 (+),score=225.28 NODE_543_length_1983_cov_17.673733_g435_i0:28-1872(+)
MTEATQPVPEDPYGISKYSFELDLKAAHEMFGMDYMIFRPHNVYGPHQNIADKYRNVIGIFINQILRGEPLTIFGDGSQTRAFSYVDDVAPVIARGALVPEARNNVFNIGADTPYTLNDLALEVSRAMGVPQNVRHLEKRNEVMHAEASHRKLHCMFGSGGKFVTLREGLEKTVAWVRAGGKKLTPVAFAGVEIKQSMPPSWVSPDLKQQTRIVHTAKDSNPLYEEDARDMLQYDHEFDWERKAREERESRLREEVRQEIRQSEMRRCTMKIEEVQSTTEKATLQRVDEEKRSLVAMALAAEKEKKGQGTVEKAKELLTSAAGTEELPWRADSGAKTLVAVLLLEGMCYMQLERTLYALAASKDDFDLVAIASAEAAAVQPLTIKAGTKVYSAYTEGKKKPARQLIKVLKKFQISILAWPVMLKKFSLPAAAYETLVVVTPQSLIPTGALPALAAAVASEGYDVAVPLSAKSIEGRAVVAGTQLVTSFLDVSTAQVSSFLDLPANFGRVQTLLEQADVSSAAATKPLEEAHASEAANKAFVLAISARFASKIPESVDNIEHLASKLASEAKANFVLAGNAFVHRLPPPEDPVPVRSASDTHKSEVVKDDSNDKQ